MRTCTIWSFNTSSIYLERIPTASMLVRVYKAPRRADGTVMGLDTVPPERWADADVLIQAPVY
jgi:hypothetical protein